MTGPIAAKGVFPPVVLIETPGRALVADLTGALDFEPLVGLELGANRVVPAGFDVTAGFTGPIGFVSIGVPFSVVVEMTSVLARDTGVEFLEGNSSPGLTPVNEGLDGLAGLLFVELETPTTIEGSMSSLSSLMETRTLGAYEVGMLMFRTPVCAWRRVGRCTGIAEQCVRMK